VFNVADMELIAGMLILMLAIHLSERRAKAAAAAGGASAGGHP
jgi:lipoprotein signal peptidase